MEVAGTVGFCAGPPPERRGRFAAVKALRARHRYARHRRFRQKCRSRVSCKTKKRRKEGKPELRYIELDILFSKTAEQTPTPQPESQGATSTCQQELAKKKSPLKEPICRRRRAEWAGPIPCTTSSLPHQIPAEREALRASGNRDDIAGITLHASCLQGGRYCS